MSSFESLINREEIRRLEKAAREKDKRKLLDWAKQYEDAVRRQYESLYQEEISNSINNFIIAIAYTAHFSEETHLGKKKLPEFMSDLFVTVDMFRTGETDANKYMKDLEKCGIKFDDYKYRHIEDEERKKKILESWVLKEEKKENKDAKTEQD